MQMRAAFKLVVRPLSALSFVVAMMGVLAVASAARRRPGVAGACANATTGGCDAHPMALAEAQALVPSPACPSPGRRGAIPAAAPKSLTRS